MDATTSFAYLTDNVPLWIEQVKDLSAHASKKYAEYVADYNRHLAHVRPKKERKPSLDSVHTERDEPLRSAIQITEPSTPDALHISPLEAGNKYLAQAQRKRKLGCSIRSGASGPQKFRSKHMVVIYYDSYLQEQLDSLVKCIGGARNNLRKGKLSRSAARGFQLPCLRRLPEYSNYGVSASDGYKKRPTSPSSLSTDPKVQLAVPTPSDDEAFTGTDKHLEVAQNLCETASHQVLRDGNCTIELNNVITKLTSVLELAVATVAQFRQEDAEPKEEEKAGDQKQTDPVTTPLADPSSPPPSLTHSFTSRLTPSFNEKMDLSPRALPVTSCGITEIEVDDDSDQESIIVDISKFRSARMTRSQGLRT
jgi:hypothetical protein